MVPITANFQSENSLNSLAQDALLAAMQAGWADPKKIGQSAANAARLRNSALESIAEKLSLTVDQIEVTGEVGLGYFLSLAGLLSHTKTLYFGAGDRSGVLATVSAHQGKSQKIALSKSGQLDFSEIAFAPDSVLAFQLANGETGAINLAPDHLLSSISKSNDLLFSVDATAAGSRVKLPEQWSSAVFDSRAWNGPSGLGIVAIRDPSTWKNPLPHISSVRRTYGTFSLPLLLASAVALENFAPNDLQLRNWNREIRSAVTSALPSTLIAGNLDDSLPHLISFIFPKCNGEEILRQLATRDIAVDSGSACTAMNLQPSHVLAAMGLPTDGNLRITLHEQTTESEIKSLITALVDVVQSLQQR